MKKALIVIGSLAVAVAVAAKIIDEDLPGRTGKTSERLRLPYRPGIERPPTGRLEPCVGSAPAAGEVADQ